MKYLVIDTETSGLFNFKLPADDPSQPRLAHLSMIGVDADLNEEWRADYYVKPAGWSMPQGQGSAGAVNGLTDAFLRENGHAIRAVLNAYVGNIEQGRAVVAFNAQFDLKTMRAELRRAGMDDLFERTPNICVMRPCTGICRIPKRAGYGFKFPKLEEALDFFNLRPADFRAHSATDDALGALLIMRKLHGMGLLPTPEVHYAKEAPADIPDFKTKPEPKAARIQKKSFAERFTGTF